jgi:hypothetical protein
MSQYNPLDKASIYGSLFLYIKRRGLLLDA